jgi:hypothetical protein
MYKIVGADQKEYGPVTAEQIHQWISQGRANAQTVARFEDGPWKPLGSFPEFANVLATSAPGVPPLAGAPPPQTTFQGGVVPGRNGMATAGLVFGVLSITCCGILGATLGLIFSLIGLAQINGNPGQYTTSKALPIAGIVLSLLGYALFALLFFTGAWEHLLKNLPKF